MKTDLPIEEVVSARIPTPEGLFQLSLFANSQDGKDHLALIHGTVSGARQVPVRVHSECITGEVFGSQRCDCGEQLRSSMAKIADAGAGVLIYLRQEGRGIGLRDKLRAYNLQDQGFDTVDANLLLGHRADERDYSIAAQIIAHLGIRSIELLTNNPSKMKALRTHGVVITRRLQLAPSVNDENRIYLQAKVERMDHLLNLAAPAMLIQKNGNGSR